MQSLTLLHALLDSVPTRLTKLPADKIELKPAPSAWSPKEELGHLLDSAANNHQRIVRAQLENKLTMPGYDGDRWVEVHRYQQRNWDELIGLWKVLNTQLLAAAQAVTDRAWSNTLTIGGAAPVTLRFVFDDYLRHMLHHLRHIGLELDEVELSVATKEQSGI
jgi:hypothetical protein